MKKPSSKFVFLILSAFALLSLLPSLPVVSNSPVLTKSLEAQAETKKRKRRPLKKKAAGKTAKAQADNKEHVIGEGSSRKQLDESVSTTKVDAVLIVDSSRSMQRTDPERLRDQGAKLFTRFLSEGDRLAIVQFDQEAKIILPFTDVTPDKISQVDTALASITNEGNFTDIEAGAALAIQLIQKSGRTDAEKAVVLISDGKMDPFPGRATAADATNLLMGSDLQLYKQMRTPIYTLSFSSEADQQLLGNLAQASGGTHWYAPTVDQIHLKFSDLFLTLKKPQVLSLDKNGFEIDNGISEATFFIARKDIKEDVILLDPRGQLIRNDNFPANVRWHKAELYDIITIRGPLPGRWSVQGIEDAGGFATLLTDLKLQVRWPETHLRVGDQVAVYARLSEGESILSTPGMEGVTYYTYKIINTADGQVVGSGALKDDGKDGDEKAGDSIYTTHVKMDEVGEYKALIAVTAATFTRQQQIPFTVTKGPIVLSLLPPDSFAGLPERAEISLSEENRSLKSLKVEVFAKRVEDGSSYTIGLKPDPERRGIYMMTNPAIPAGEYQIYARFSGKGAKDKTVQGASETLKFTASGNSEVMEADEDAANKVGWGWGLTFVILSSAWSGAVGFFFLRNFSVGKATEVKMVTYEISPELEAQLVKMREKASKQRREANLDDVKQFALVKDVFPKHLAKQVGKSAPQLEPEESEIEESAAPAETVATGEENLESEAVEETSAETETEAEPNSLQARLQAEAEAEVAAEAAAEAEAQAEADAAEGDDGEAEKTDKEAS